MANVKVKKSEPSAPKPVPQPVVIKEQTITKSEKVIDYKKYDNFIDYGNSVQFDNPHTGRPIVVSKGTEKCPWTGKSF